MADLVCPHCKKEVEDMITLIGDNCGMTTATKNMYALKCTRCGWARTIDLDLNMSVSSHYYPSYAQPPKGHFMGVLV